MKNFLVTIFLLFSSEVYAEIVLYCMEELSSGISKQSGSWDYGRFKPGDYTIKFSDDYKQLEIVDLAENFDCAPTYIMGTTLSCISKGKKTIMFHYRPQDKRFVLATTSPFTGASEGNDTSEVSIGNCDSF